MSIAPRVTLLGIVVGLAACGGGGSGGGPLTNAWTGTVSISGGTTGVETHLVTFTATGASPQSISAVVGDKIQFHNGDAVGNHRPVGSTVGPSCSVLTSPIELLPGGDFTTPALVSAGTCFWADGDNLPSGGGGGGY